MRRFAITLAMLIAVVTPTTLGAGCHSLNPVFGNPNLHPVLDLTSLQQSNNYRFLKQVPNGKLYQVTVPQNGGADTSTFYVQHLWGNAYELGVAQGQLFEETAASFISNVWAYMESQVEKALPGWIPAFLEKLIADFGLDAALDLTEELTRTYTGQYFYDELKGLSDSAKIDYQTLVRVHMLAGLTQGKCSMVGAWGAALDPAGNTTLLQLRALDWDMDGPFRDYSVLTVYHPDEGYPFALVGMVGFIGGLTGMNANKMGISEIGVAFPDLTFGTESRIGYPFIFLLRDILQWDLTIDDAINRMANTRRTCDLILGVGDGKLNQFRAFQYSYSVLNIQDDLNMQPFNSSWHPRIPNTVYYGMDWVCPGYNILLSNLIKKYYGRITPEVGIKYISPMEGSGDNHVAWYDLTNMQMWVSYAAPHSATGGSRNAFDRQFTKFDMNKLFAEVKPTL